MSVGMMIGLGAIILLVVVFALVGTGVTAPGPGEVHRACPVCGSELDNDDRVFADEITRENGPSELKIKGCTHCYDRT